VITPSLPFVDVLHANAEEAMLLHGRLPEVQARMAASPGSHFDDVIEYEEVVELAASFIRQGAALVTLTLGANGVYTAITDNTSRLNEFKSFLLSTSLSYAMTVKKCELDAAEIERHMNESFRAGKTFLIPAFQMKGAKKNTTGAGDGFVGGVISGLCRFASDRMTIEDVVLMGQLAALSRITNATKLDANQEIQMPKNNSLRRVLEVQSNKQL